MFLLFFLLEVPVLVNYAISIGITILFIIISQFIFKRNVLLYSQIIVLVSITVSFVFHALFNKYFVLSNCIYVVVSGVVLIFLLMFIQFTKTLSAKYLRRTSWGVDKILINDYILTGSMLRNILTMYLLILFCYKQMTLSRPNDVLDNVFYYIVPLIIFLAIYIYQAYRNIHIFNKLKKEEWLPIMDQDANILGKIEKSLGLKANNKYWHPVIRIMLVKGDSVYLQDRPENDKVSPSKLDTPLESYVTCENGADATILNLLKKFKVKDLSQVEFLFNYDFENPLTKRISYLYVYRIEDDNLCTIDNTMNGKFWSIKRIEEHFDETYLSELFILEYEYLKNMVLTQTESYLR